MSWLCRDPEIFEDDWHVLGFKPEKSRILTIECDDCEKEFENTWLKTTDKEWWEWLDKDHTKRRSGGNSRINLILGGRAQSPWGHDPGAVSTLPWSREVFVEIKKRFLIHGLIVRTINRNTSCMFSQMDFNWDMDGSREKSLVYLCRTPASWPGDMALSVTFCPSTLTTNAVLFGCDLKKPDMYDETMTLADIVTSRLKNSDIEIFHPMLLPTIFADCERDRQIELVREKLGQLGRRIDNATFDKTHSAPKTGYHDHWSGSDSDTATGHPETDMSSTSSANQEIPTAKLWQDISRLRIGLENWRKQLVKMNTHVEELEKSRFLAPTPGTSPRKYEEKHRLQFIKTGKRIQGRLGEIIDEYDEYIRECTHIMDGFTLATQLEISQINRSDAKTNQDISRVTLEVSQMTRRDGSIMKAIAILGMVFLPSSLTTAFFSMDLFDSSMKADGYVASKLLWIYAIAALSLTLSTMGAFYFCVLRRRNSKKADGSMGLSIA